MNASILYLDTSLYNVTYKFFDPEFLPGSDCWDIRFFNQGFEPDISIGGLDLIASYKPYGMSNPLECPNAAAMIQSSGKMVPRKHIRDKVETYLREMRQNYSQIISVHARTAVTPDMLHTESVNVLEHIRNKLWNYRTCAWHR